MLIHEFELHLFRAVAFIEYMLWFLNKETHITVRELKKNPSSFSALLFQ